MYDTLKVANAVLVLLGEPVGWESFQKAVKGTDFMSNVGNMDYDKVSEETLHKVHEYKGLFNIQEVESKAGKAFALWVIGMESMATCVKTLMPKIKKQQEDADQAAAEFNQKKGDLA